MSRFGHDRNETTGASMIDGTAVLAVLAVLLLAAAVWWWHSELPVNGKDKQK